MITEGGEDLPAEPENAHDRKLKRLERINRRLDHAAKVNNNSNNLEQSDGEIFQENLFKTIGMSNENIFQIFVSGKEMVTNIRVSSDTREIDRRKDELLSREARLLKLENDAAAAQEKLQIIERKWEKFQSIIDPLDLCEELRQQRNRCLDLIDQKNAVITELKKELAEIDDRYVSDRADMWEDICVLSRRINDQVVVMKRMYEAEIGNFEETIQQSTETLQKNQGDKWEKLYDEREMEEIISVSTRLQTVEKEEEEILHLHLHNEEKYREIKIMLDSDVQVLEQELERIKATCLVNSEKLNYNYQVLKKREDENVIVKNNQKRMLNRLQEEAVKLKKKIRQKDSAMKQELEKLKKEVCRLREDILDIEKKCDHFAKVNDKKFLDIWKMKSKEADDLIAEVYNTDRIIHERLLDVECETSKNEALKLEDLTSYKSAVAIIEEVFLDQGEANKVTGEITLSESKNEKMLQVILNLVAENTEFLNENKLTELLKPYKKEEQTLVRLDNALNAIGVKTTEDVNSIQDFFLPYVKCTRCPNSEVSGGEIQQFLCLSGHSLFIDKQDILKALREFACKLHSLKIRQQKDVEIRLVKDRCTISRLLSVDDIQRYWTSYLNVFPKENEVLWDTLHEGLLKYYSMLQECSKLRKKALGLKQQNLELKALLERTA